MYQSPLCKIPHAEIIYTIIQVLHFLFCSVLSTNMNHLLHSRQGFVIQFYFSFFISECAYTCKCVIKDNIVLQLSGITKPLFLYIQLLQARHLELGKI